MDVEKYVLPPDIQPGQGAQIFSHNTGSTTGKRTSTHSIGAKCLSLFFFFFFLQCCIWRERRPFDSSARGVKAKTQTGCRNPAGICSRLIFDLDSCLWFQQQDSVLASTTSTPCWSNLCRFSRFPPPSAAWVAGLFVYCYILFFLFYFPLPEKMRRNVVIFVVTDEMYVHFAIWGNESHRCETEIER